MTTPNPSTTATPNRGEGPKGHHRSTEPAPEPSTAQTAAMKLDTPPR